MGHENPWGLPTIAVVKALPENAALVLKGIRSECLELIGRPPLLDLIRHAGAEARVVPGGRAAEGEMDPPIIWPCRRGLRLGHRSRHWL